MHAQAVATIQPYTRSKFYREIFSFLSCWCIRKANSKYRRKGFCRLWRRAAATESRCELAAVGQCPTLWRQREHGPSLCRECNFGQHWWSFWRLYYYDFYYLNKETPQALLKNWTTSFQRPDHLHKTREAFPKYKIQARWVREVTEE